MKRNKKANKWDSRFVLETTKGVVIVDVDHESNTAFVRIGGETSTAAVSAVMNSGELHGLLPDIMVLVYCSPWEAIATVADALPALGMRVKKVTVLDSD